MAPAGVLTVADLLNRNPRVPAQVTHDHDDEPATVPAPVVTVSSLLEREGLTPPKGAPATATPSKGSAKVAEPKERKPATSGSVNPLLNRVNLRRGAVAAGTLLAAGSVFGVAMIASPTTASNNAALGADEGAYPGQGILDDGPTDNNGVLPPESLGNPLDAGVAPPTTWIPVAFPSIQAGVPQGPVADSGNRNDGGSTTPTTNNAGNAGNAGNNGATGGGGSQSAAAPGGASNDGGGNGGGAEKSGGVVETLGNTVTGVTSGLGNTLNALVGNDDGGSSDENAGGGDTDVQAAAPAAKKSSNGGLLSPVTNLLSGGSTSAPQASNDDDSDSHSESSNSDGGSDDDDSDSGDSGGSDNGGGDSDGGGSGGGGLLSSVGKTLGGLLG